jgi:hypothetical protein
MADEIMQITRTEKAFKITNQYSGKQVSDKIK